MLSLFKKHAAVIATLSLLGVGAAWAQSLSTVLGPNTTTVSVGTSATLAALPANPTRKALTICNGHASQSATFTTGAVTPVSLTTGQVLPGGNVAASCFTIGQPGLATSGGVGAQINVIASGASTPVTFIEYF